MSDYWKNWLKSAGIRALRTLCQTAISAISVQTAGKFMGITDIDWLTVLSVAGLAAVLSMITSLGGLPEVPKIENKEEENQ